MRVPRALIAAIVLAPVVASAEAQLQVDGGLSVIGGGYEHSLSPHVSLQGEVFVFGTYFLPWFDAGDDLKGFGAGLRPTWFMRESHHGLYVTPYLRGVIVDDESIVGMDGLGFTAGLFAGWAWPLSNTLDLRIGAGAQYIHAHVDTDQGRSSTNTPFIALDAVVGYRL